MWKHFKQSLSGNYGDFHSQLGKILSSAIDNAVYEYDTSEFDRRDALARKGETISFVLCDNSSRGMGCTEYYKCRFLHKQRTAWQE